jgi:hypothetical protein
MHGCIMHATLQVFNELDNRDEADMLTLAAFFQTVCGTSIRTYIHIYICYMQYI